MKPFKFALFIASILIHNLANATVLDFSSLVKEGKTDQSVLNEYLNKKKPVIIKFFGKDCRPCIQMKSIFENLSNSYINATKSNDQDEQAKIKITDKIIFIEIDTFKHSTISDHYDLKSIPTFIFFNDSQKELERIPKATTFAKLESLIEKYYKIKLLKN